MEIFQLMGSIFIDNEKANQSLDETDKKAASTGKSFGDMIGTAAAWGAGIVTAAAAAGVGLFSLASNVSDAASEINDMSVRTGLSTTTLQELKFATGQVGVNFESITGAVGKLTKTMAGADDGSKAAEAAFAKLGISVTDSEGNMRKMDEVFPEVIKGLAGMGNETERNQLAMDFFGKGATELVPLLSAGGDGIDALTQQAHDLGLVMSDEAISAGDNFGDSLDAIKGALGGVVATVGVELMPMFQTMFNWIMGNMPAIQEGIHTAFSVAGEVIGTTIDGVKSLTSFFKEHWDAIQPILAGILAGGVTFGIYTLAINAAALATGIWTTVTGIATAAGTAFGVVLAFITSPIGIVVIAIGLLVAAGVLLYKHWDEVSTFLETTWTSVKTKAEEIFNALVTFFETTWTSIQTKAAELWDGIKTAILETWNGFITSAKEVFDPVITFFETTWTSIKTKAVELWDGIKTAVVEKWNNLKTTATETFGGIKTSLGGIWDDIATKVGTVWDGVVSTVKGSINSVIQSINGFIRSMNNIEIRVPSVTIPLVGTVGGFTVGMPDIPEIPMLAKGGDITAAGRVLVGEQGPEFLDLPRGARVSPLDKAAAPQIVININEPHLFNDRDANKLGDLLANRIRVKTGLRL